MKKILNTYHYKNIKISKILMMILLFSFCISNLNFFSVFGHNIKLYRIILVTYFLILFIDRKQKIPSKKLFFFLIFMIISSIINYFSYGFDRLLFDYIFAFLIMIVVYNGGKNLSKDEWIDIVQKISFVILILIFVNIYFQKDIIIDYLKKPITNHPQYNCIFTGGCNLEATWPALFSFFYINEPKKGFIYLAGCFAISIILSSRIGLILDVIGLIYLIYIYLKNINKKINKRTTILIIFLILIVFGIFLFSTELASNVLNRMRSIGKDSGSIGRINIWKYILDAFLKRPFGYGCGNAIIGVKSFSKIWIGEDNVHNLFFQMLLDFGIIGFIIYCYIVINFVKNNLKDFFKNPVVSFLIMYLLVSMIQFKGAELITFYVLGIYFVLYDKKDGDNVK